MEISARQTLALPRTAQARVVAIGCGALTIAICAQIRVYLGFTDVPVTLQVFGILLVAFALGARLATWSAVTYIVAGAMGAPVFGGFQGGAAYLLSGTSGLIAPTLGYILAFPVAANLVGGLWQDRKHTSFAYAWLIALFGVAYVFLGGFAWQSVQRIPVMGLKTGLATAFAQSVAPFILLDVAKAAIAAAIAAGVYKGRVTSNAFTRPR